MSCRELVAVIMAACVISAEAQDTIVLFRQAAGRERTDMAGAVRLYQQAAGLGHTPSMVRLGYLRQSGTGVTKDPAAAFALFSRAAQGGNVDGQFLLAMSYAQGLGTAKDPVAARRWFLQPAAAGYQYAQFALGVMLETGEGGPRKLAAARRWMDRAASGSDSTLAAHSAKVRDKIDEKLFSMDTSGTFLVGLILVMALAGTVLQEGGGGSPSGPSDPGSPGGGSPAAPRIRCHLETVFGSTTLNGRDSVLPSQQTRMVCE